MIQERLCVQCGGKIRNKPLGRITCSSFCAAQRNQSISERDRIRVPCDQCGKIYSDKKPKIKDKPTVLRCGNCRETEKVKKEPLSQLTQQVMRLKVAKKTIGQVHGILKLSGRIERERVSAIYYGKPVWS